jgi:hypothetical protein
MRNQNQPTGCAGVSIGTRRAALIGPLLGALLGGCGSGTAEDVALPLALAAPATAANSAQPLPAMTAPAEMLAAMPATTAPPPVAAAVGSDATKDAVRAAAPAGRRAASSPHSLSIPLALDADVPHPIVIECVEASGAGAAMPQPSIPQCPAGDALPPASSPRSVSALQVVDPTTGRDAGVLPLSR